MIRIGLIGDYNAAIIAHQAIPEAIRLAGTELGVDVGSDCSRRTTWATSGNTPACGVYRGVLIEVWTERCARYGLPAKSVGRIWERVAASCMRHRVRAELLGWEAADHAETAPSAHRPVICISSAIGGSTNNIRLRP